MNSKLAARLVSDAARDVSVEEDIARNAAQLALEADECTARGEHERAAALLKGALLESGQHMRRLSGHVLRLGAEVVRLHQRRED